MAFYDTVRLPFLPSAPQLLTFVVQMNDLANMEQEVQRLCADSYRISTVKRIEELESEIGKVRGSVIPRRTTR